MATRLHFTMLLLASCLVSCSGEASTIASLYPPLPPAPKPEASPGPLRVPTPGEPVKSAAEILLSDVWVLLTGRDYQAIVATFAFVFGIVALVDGPNMVKIVTFLTFATVAFVVALSQLESTWEGPQAIAKYFAAFEVALFVGFAAYKTWEGTQLILGALFGLYIFECEQALASFMLISDSHQAAWIVLMGTACIVVGIAMVHDRYGGPKVLGALASLFGGSLVISALGWFSMFVCTLPSPPVHVSITAAQVASVYEFWYMMVLPMKSEPVGLFTATNHMLNFGSYHFDIDRILCIFFWMVLFTCGARLQVRASNRKVTDTLKARLLPQHEARGFENAVIKIEV